MIITEPEQQPGPKQPEHQPEASTSSAPPPFEDSVLDPVVQVSDSEVLIPYGGEEPPSFAPYEASYFTSSNGSIISHDLHLNEDGEALYRFVLSQASVPPKLVLHCEGSHNETHVRFVNHDHNGHRRMETEEYTERVVDFDFKIDVGQHITGGLTHWSVADFAPAYRGRMFREVGVDDQKRKATRAERKAADAWEDERARRGFPPWIGSDYTWREDQPAIMHIDSVLKSSWTVRRWADDFCSSGKYLKEFDYEKVVYGWNFDAIISATQALIKSTYYRGDIQVRFETSHSLVSVRSENRLSRALSNGWIKFLLIITLIYPFVWLFRRFHHRGGGSWKVCGGAYALKRTARTTEVPRDVNHAGNPFHDAPSALQSLDVLDPFRQPSGSSLATKVSTIEGIREGEWFREWEGTIRRAVYNRLQEAEPLVRPDHRPPSIPQAALLDGY
ncbi:hypothetical protein ID866_2426 [Astraeus odoratus]|nr:hypothetical protein ID866_2426 [Astraeus odoratus]